MKIALATVAVHQAAAFAPKANVAVPSKALHAEASVALPPPNRPIFDPLGLYPENSPERLAGLIQPLEGSMTVETKVVTDPLGLYTDRSQLSNAKMSASLPFLRRPNHLDGTLPGDRGFDPFHLASDASSLAWQRRAEIKHARLAMLAVAGWSTAELFHERIASALDLPAMLASGGRVPSVLNDGLSHSPFPVFWIAAIAAASLVELSQTSEYDASRVVDQWLDPADGRLDLNLGPQTASTDVAGSADEDIELTLQVIMNHLSADSTGIDDSHYPEGNVPVSPADSDNSVAGQLAKEAELFNGRLGMLAITGFAIQEWLLGTAVVDQTPFLFKPLNVAIEHLVN